MALTEKTLAELELIARLSHPIWYRGGTVAGGGLPLVFTVPGAGPTFFGLNFDEFFNPDTGLIRASALPPGATPTTLDANADLVLSLTGQEIGLDTQVMNTVFAGPAAGADAAPIFRTLVDADIPAAIARDAEVTAAIGTHAGLPDVHHAQAHVLNTSGPHTGPLQWSDVAADIVNADVNAAAAILESKLALNFATHAEVHVLAATGPHTGTLPWGDLSKTGSSLADLVTRAHANLSDAPANAHHVAFVKADADLLYDVLGGLSAHASDSDAHGGKVSKSIMYHFPDADLAVGDFVSESAIRVPAAGEHGAWTPQRLRVRALTAGTGGTATVTWRYSSTIGGARTTLYTATLAAAGVEGEDTVLDNSWPGTHDDLYLWCECATMTHTLAPTRVVAQVDIEEAIY